MATVRRQARTLDGSAVLRITPCAPACMMRSASASFIDMPHTTELVPVERSVASQSITAGSPNALSITTIAGDWLRTSSRPLKRLVAEPPSACRRIRAAGFASPRSSRAGCRRSQSSSKSSCSSSILPAYRPSARPAGWERTRRSRSSNPIGHRVEKFSKLNRASLSMFFEALPINVTRQGHAIGPLPDARHGKFLAKQEDIGEMETSHHLSGSSGLFHGLTAILAEVTPGSPFTDLKGISDPPRAAPMPSTARSPICASSTSARAGIRPSPSSGI